MKRLLSVLLSAFLVFVTAGCGGAANQGPAPAGEGAQTTVVKHQLGEMPVPLNPQRVAVFDYGILDSLDKLGVPVVAVPQSNLPPYLEKYNDEQYVNAGSLTEPDLEALSGVNPDLIIISGRQAESYEALSELAPTVYMAIDTTQYMASFRQNMETLGTIFGKADDVAAALAEIDGQIAAVKGKVTAAGKNALIILANDRAISAYGPGSRFGLIHDVLGFAPVDPNIEVSTHGMNVSFEYVKEQDPDYLFVVDRGSVVAGGTAVARDTLENDLVKTTKAYQNGKIIYLDPNYWYLSGGGLVSVAQMVEEIAASVE